MRVKSSGLPRGWQMPAPGQGKICKLMSRRENKKLAKTNLQNMDINQTLGLLPPRRYEVWRDSVGVESSGSGLKSECADIFHQSFLCCYAILTSRRGGLPLDNKISTDQFIDTGQSHR